MLSHMLRNASKTNFLMQDIKNIVTKNMRATSTSSSNVEEKYETLNVSNPSPFVYHVELNRPKKMNALNHPMWLEINKCFNSLSENSDCRVIVLSGNGKMFCAGIDFTDVMNWGPTLSELPDVARKCKFLLSAIKKYQECISSLEKCTKPVIAAVHSGCIGGAFDLITSADIRYCSSDAWFQVKEVDIGMAADVGTLQRLPKVIGSESLVRELCFTARKMESSEALQCGLVSKISNDKESLLNDSLKLAELIAKKSPVAVQGTKRSLIYSRDHSVQEGLDHIALWNQTMLLSEDFLQAVMGAMSKDEVTFSKL